MPLLQETRDGEWVKGMFLELKYYEQTAGYPHAIDDLVVNTNNVFFQSMNGGMALIWSSPRTYRFMTFIRSENVTEEWLAAAYKEVVKKARRLRATRIFMIASGNRGTDADMLLRWRMKPTKETWPLKGFAIPVFQRFL